MDDLAKQLNISPNDIWNSLSAKSLKEHGGAGLLKKYNGSYTKLLENIFPEFKHSCRQYVHRIVSDLQLGNVKDILNVPLEYLHCQLLPKSLTLEDI